MDQLKDLYKERQLHDIYIFLQNEQKYCNSLP